MTQNLIEQLDILVARSEGSRTASARREALEEAIVLACAAMKRVVRDITAIAKGVMTTHGLADEGEVNFRDRVNALSDGSLSMFASRESLSEYLDATKPLIQKQLDVSEKKTTQFISAILTMYDDYIDQTITADHLVVWCNRLKSLFCRPPNGGLGEATPPLLPEGGGGNSATESRVREWITVIASVVSAASATAALFIAARQATALDKFASEERESKIGLYACLLIAGVTSQADTNGLLPAFVAPDGWSDSDEDALTDAEIEALVDKVPAGSTRS